MFFLGIFPAHYNFDSPFELAGKCSTFSRLIGLIFVSFYTECRKVCCTFISFLVVKWGHLAC